MHTVFVPPIDTGLVVAMVEAWPCHSAASEAFVCWVPPHQPGSALSPPGLQICPHLGVWTTRNCCCRFGGQHRSQGIPYGCVVSLRAGSHHPVPCSWLRDVSMSWIPLSPQAQGSRTQGSRCHMARASHALQARVAQPWSGHSARGVCGVQGCAHRRTKGCWCRVCASDVGITHIPIAGASAGT